jgi:hypothetical protein
VSILAGDGHGTFQLGAEVSTGSKPSDVSIADFDDNTFLDIAVTNQGAASVSVLLATQMGRYDERFDYSTASHNPVSSVVTDLNHDNRPDIVTASLGATSEGHGGTISVYTGAGDGTFIGPVTYGVLGGACSSVAVGDLDRSGSLDLALTARDSSALSVVLAATDGTFVNSWKDVPSGGGSPTTVTMADINGDTSVDVIASLIGAPTVDIGVFPGDGAGQLSLPGYYAAGGNVNAVVVGDLNHDAFADLVVANLPGSLTVLLGAGNGNFAQPVPYPAGQYPYSPKLADLNDDGHIDIVTAVSQSDAVSVYLGVGDGSFALPIESNSGAFPVGIAVGDVNGDRVLDLITTNTVPTNSISVLIGRGDGTFERSVDLATGQAPSSPSLADIDSDGTLDLIVVSRDDQSVKVMLGDGHGEFRSAGTFLTEKDPRSIYPGDIDGDGYVDLVVSNGSNFTITVFLGPLYLPLQRRYDFGLTGCPTDLAVGDLNSDGKLDIATANSHAGSLSVLFNSCQQLR